MKVLFLGNSHTYFNDMPHIFQMICKEKGKDVRADMLAYPGVTYYWHYGLSSALRYALMHGGYDCMFMQQAAHVPCPPAEETLRDGAAIIALARKCGVEPIQTVPWAEKRLPSHQKEMYSIFSRLAEENHVRLNPVGNVFEDVFENYPDINLYFYDGEHANEYGSYVIALCAFATLFNESVQGVSPRSCRLFDQTAEEFAAGKAKVREIIGNMPEPSTQFEAFARGSAVMNAVLPPVTDPEKLYVDLDPEKCAVLQHLTDKYALRP